MSSGQIPLWSPQAKHSHFDNFEVKEESMNMELLENMRSYILSSEATPFFLYGESGAGKTHLLLAAANLARELGAKDVVYFDCASGSVNPQMLLSCMQKAYLFIDNIGQWNGNGEAEKALFAIVEHAKNNKQCLIVSAKAAPQHNDIVLADLVSRLSSGMVFQLTALDDAGKMKALRQNAIARNLNVEDKVLQHLLTHFTRDNHSLFAALDQLDRASMIEKRKLTIPFVQQVLLN